MTNFRIKKKKNKKKKMCNFRGSTTLDKKHKQKVKYFNNKKNSKDKIKNSLNNIIQELELIDKKRLETHCVDFEYRAKLLNLKDEYELELENITNNYEEMDYYDKAGDIIIKYYELRNESVKKVKETKNIIDFLSNKNSSKEENNREELFNSYCKRIDGIKIKKDDGKNRIKYCKLCEIEKILDESKSAYICPNCGEMEIIIIDEDRQIKEYSPYKRLNHFKEWLNQFQAKESTEIPEVVYKNIIMELNKNRITDLSILNRDKMQYILKKIGYNHLYEHIPYIINKLNNLPPPKIDRNTETKFLQMFMKIQDPWELYKPKGRKNFLSYSYILYKFCELLELDHLLEYFPLLKSPEKLMDQDQIWKKFCKYLKWEFYPTFR